MSADIYTKILKRLVDKGLLQLDDLVERGVIEESAIDKMMADILADEKIGASVNEEVIPKKLGTSSNSFGRYENLEFIAEGGMAKVYKAYDQELKRNVALKFLRIEDPSLKDRLLREARAQAGIDHPSICKVYEVGEQNGRPYIAMQHLNGMTLKETAPHLGLEQKVLLIKRVADSLQEAHRLGLIHRDIKPSNIIVEPSSNGQWNPFLVDFGLARQVAEDGMTITNFIVGTPQYMSPEQTSGRVHNLDRRSDIYSLGVTFYELMCGQLPYKENGGSLVQSVITEEAIPLRKKNTSIPSDLETIVMKCLEKEPNRRYESSKALADDLQHYLNGEPIHAKPAKLGYRLLKKAKKNKIAATILAGAILLSVFLAGMLVWIEWRSRQQTKYANEFNQEVRYIESMMRSVYMAPLHDIRPELNRARKRLSELEKRVDQAGEYALGPGHNALGQGYLAIEEYEKAKGHLEKAWNAGYTEASTAYGLGRSMGYLYQQALQEAERLRSKETSEANKEMIEKTYRDPAIAFLKMSVGHIVSRDYVEGLIALYEKRYKPALNMAHRAQSQIAWSYDGKKLEADVHTALGQEARDSGDYDGAVKAFKTAGEAYAAAAQMGRSEKGIYLGDCDRWLKTMLVETDQGLSPSNSLEKALDACDKAIFIDPDSSKAYRDKALGYIQYARYKLSSTGEDPRELLKNSIFWANEAVKKNSNYWEGYREIGTAYFLIGDYEWDQGSDPQATMNLALGQLSKAIKINPNDPFSHQIAGSIYYKIGEVKFGHRENPQQPLRKSIQYSTTALKINPKNFGTLNNLGLAYNLLGIYELTHGLNPESSLQNAITQYQKGLQLNSKHFLLHGNLAFTYEMFADWEKRNGRDPRPTLQLSIQHCRKALQINPNFLFAFYQIADSLSGLGGYEIKIGGNPQPVLQELIEQCQKALKINPHDYEIHMDMATGFFFMSLHAVENGIDPTSFIESARFHIYKSLETYKQDALVYQIEGLVELLAARWSIQQFRSPYSFFKRAQKAIHKSIQLNDQESNNYLALADYSRWEAEWLQKQKRSSKEVIAQGHERINKALALDPKNSESFAIQGVLFLLQAQEEESSQKVTTAKLAESAFRQAFKIDPLLKREYEPLMKKAIALIDASN